MRWISRLRSWTRVPQFNWSSSSLVRAQACNAQFQGAMKQFIILPNKIVIKTAMGILQKINNYLMVNSPSSYSLNDYESFLLDLPFH